MLRIAAAGAVRTAPPQRGPRQHEQGAQGGYGGDQQRHGRDVRMAGKPPYRATDGRPYGHFS